MVQTSTAESGGDEQSSENNQETGLDIYDIPEPFEVRDAHPLRVLWVADFPDCEVGETLAVRIEWDGSGDELVVSSEVITLGVDGEWNRNKSVLACATNDFDVPDYAWAPRYGTHEVVDDWDEVKRRALQTVRGEMARYSTEGGSR